VLYVRSSSYLTHFAELNNRVAFIDFVRGLLHINPLERWSPQQAKLHPFITQQKFTQPFVPPMNLKSPASGRPPAPGVQQQQQAEAVSKQRQAAQAAQVQAQAQQNAAAQSAYAMQMNQYQQAQAPPVYNNVYATNQAGQQPPPYPTQSAYAPPAMTMLPQQQGYGHPQQTLYAQATTRAGRQRASTMDQQQGGIPASIQRVASHLDPNAPIRLQPSPAYYPPPAGGYAEDSPSSSRRGGRREQRNRDFIRTLEDGAMTGNQWH
jgi:dual specificity protein kinase YAK1